MTLQSSATNRKDEFSMTVSVTDKMFLESTRELVTFPLPPDGDSEIDIVIKKNDQLAFNQIRAELFIKN